MARRYVLLRGEAKNYRAEFTRGGDCVLWCGEGFEWPAADYPEEFERWRVLGVGPIYVVKERGRLYAEMPVLVDADGEKLVTVLRGEAKMLPLGREVCGDVPESAVVTAGECPPLEATRAGLVVEAELMEPEHYAEREDLGAGALEVLFAEPPGEMALISQAVAFTASFVDRVLYD